MAEKRKQHTHLKNGQKRAICQVLLLAGIVLAMTGLGVMAAGGLCIDKEGAVWALALFFIGIVAALTGIVLIAVSIPLEIKYSRARRVRGRAIAPNAFVIGRTVLTFLNEGMYIKKGKEEPFEEGRIVVPYSVIKAYHTTKRKRPTVYGHELTYVKMPAYFLREGKSGNIAYTLEANRQFVRMLDKHCEYVRDSRTEPSEKPKRMKSFDLSNMKRKKTISTFAWWGAIVFLSLACVGLGVMISGEIAAGCVIAGVGLLTGAFTAGAGYFSYREVITVYHNGLYWKDGLASFSFLPWAEVDAVTHKRCGDGRVIIFDCGYCFRGILDGKGFYEYIKEKFPEKCGEE